MDTARDTCKGRLFGEAEDEFLPFATITVSKDAEDGNYCEKASYRWKWFL